MPRITSVVTMAGFAAAMSGPAPAQDANGHDGAAARLEAAVPALLERSGVPGVAMALADRNGVTWSGTFGLRDATDGAAVDGETVFAAASLTKPVFTYAVLKLIDRGDLELDRPLVEYAPLPDIAHDPRHARLTARMVLSHTTGLPNWRRRGGRLEFVADPGERWGYSGEGFVLLAGVVEHVTGAKVDALVRDLVLDPLGLSRASLRIHPDIENLAVPHDERGAPRTPHGPAVNVAASLACTATEYARFLSALLRGEGLSRELVAEMGRVQVEISPGVSWGLGLGIEEGPGGPTLWQWGHNDGYRAYALASPSRDLAFVFLSNGDGGMLMLRDLVRLATGDDAHPALEHLGYERYDSPGRVVRLALEEAMANGDPEAALAKYEALRRVHPAEAFGENLLNRLGYSLLFADPPRVEEALVIFRKNVELYPEAFNPWDSLGEALLLAGERAEALAAYERSVELNPANDNGVEAIRRIRAEMDAAARGASGDASASVDERIASYLDAWARRGELSGVVLAARGDEVIFRRAYGLADVERGIANTPETVFHVASLTKTFTAAAILRLEDRGELSLSDPLSRFMPWYPRGDEITLEHLLGHASGIPDHHRLPGFEEESANGITLEDLVRWQSRFPLEYEPGRGNRYVNSGYAVLARVVEIVSGQPFPEFVRAHLLDPLGMASTGEVGAAGEGETTAKGYQYGPPPSHRIAVPKRDYGYAMGSGSMASTADDLVTWLRAVDHKMLHDVHRTPWPYGWGRERYGRLPALEQTGAHAGFTATITVVPAADVYVVHLSNLQAGLPFQRVHRDVARIVLGEPVEPPAALARVAWDPADGARYAGTYSAGDDDAPTPHLTADETGLWWRWVPEQPPQYLQPLGERRYYLGADGCELIFEPAGPGAEPRFELREPWNPGGPYKTYVRVP